MKPEILAVIEKIENGESMRKAVAAVGMSWSAFAREIQGDKTAAQQYARAQEIRADLLADDVIEIADTESDAQRARNRIDARKWSSGKLAPKKYGERIDLNVTTSIDVGATIAEARARLRPPCDLANVIEGEIIEKIDVSPSKPSDEKSDTPDIFT